MYRDTRGSVRRNRRCSSLVIRVMLQIKEGRVSDECKLTLILPVYRQYTVITNRFLFYAIFTSSLCFNFTLPM